ncbi:type VII secretion integral membrane protein EccD [Allokutzneria sp. NRRL B-24872]|uniref:type VII secretion integral membrane protein EccD n=1 Tax=Allokutzneria sp. NRRL B-24872 TaxID=1137961 RepID=UPI000A3BDF71|nr:type VII secretion integral membrane protein EccD [Allokutzneria sp. NRRL B-24872]
MATATTVFSRVTVLAPQTRIDVALPSDVAVADLLPKLLNLAGQATQDGGARHGGWCLAKLGEPPLDLSRTLASLGVVDGDLVQLRRRTENPPPPLYDDVVDAIADAEPGGLRPWTSDTARRLGNTACGLALVTAAVAVHLAGGRFPLAAAITAGVAALVAIAAGSTLIRAHRAPDSGVVVAAAGALPMAFVCGLHAVPGALGPASLVLAFAAAGVISVVSLLVLGCGITVFVAGAGIGATGALAGLVAAFLPGSVPGIAAGTAAIALATLSVLPRLTIQLAKLPLPHVPGSAAELKEDDEFPDYAVIERRAGLAHQYMTGMLIASGVAAAAGAVLAAGGPSWFGPLFGGVVAAVLLLRARTYANGGQAIALLATGLLTATGLMIGWLLRASPLHLLLWVFGLLVVLAAASITLGVVFPKQRFSPVLRRSVDVAEAVLIASVLPLALAVMDLYSVVRHL